MKEFVDRKGCIGCTLCASICPEVFSMEEDGKAKSIDTEIPEPVLKGAREAEESCPVLVIKVE